MERNNASKRGTEFYGDKEVDIIKRIANSAELLDHLEKVYWISAQTIKTLDEMYHSPRDLKIPESKSPIINTERGQKHMGKAFKVKSCSSEGQRTLMKETKFKKILEAHAKWLEDSYTGERASFINADLSKLDLRNVDLRYADLRGANFSGTNLIGAQLQGADMTGATFYKTKLRGAALSRSLLVGCSLCRFDLTNVDLSGCNLNEVDFSGATLKGADLHGCSLCGTNLTRAILDGANFYGADLSNAILSEASLLGACLDMVNLSEVQGLVKASEYLAEHFEHTEDGYVVYKALSQKPHPLENWKRGAIMEKVCDPNRANSSGCGIDVATLGWVRSFEVGTIYKLLIRWAWLPDVIVPFNTIGKIRCGKVEILEAVDYIEEDTLDIAEDEAEDFDSFL